jgi:heptaprenyl diphosphate synthase
MSAGQQLETAGATHIGTVDEVLAVAWHKSGAMVATFCVCGAIAAGGSRKVVSTCSRFGSAVGVARQLTTDVAELASGAGTDVRAGVATLPVSLRAAGLSGAERDAFVRRFAAAARSESAHRQLVDELWATGALGAAQLHVELAIADASVALSDVGASSSTRDELMSIVEFGSRLIAKELRHAESSHHAGPI